ncbi:hypothetical protein M9H77_14363 [Catharanthus roseus]|uniref:Uncharacterized protein n=1 Tax=Catharanthus roseus TaxID=4058 RepID=A0ACC0BMT9_CATRO|nr:hypothetical protein M9H77_14363 [Catharanthus roseus]
MTSKPIIKYLLFLERYNLACFLIGDVFHNVLPCSLEMHRTGALYRASSDDVDGFRLWRVDLLERGSNTVEGLARVDGHLVESQEEVEIKVGLRVDLIGARGSVAWFYVCGECDGYGIERSAIILERDQVLVVDVSDGESVEGPAV